MSELSSYWPLHQTSLASKAIKCECVSKWFFIQKNSTAFVPLHFYHFKTSINFKYIVPKIKLVTLKICYPYNFCWNLHRGRILKLEIYNLRQK
jgi:hypothetical protein